MKDPVCGMQVELTNAETQSQDHGENYSFCSLSCKRKFDLNPSVYVRPDIATALVKPDVETRAPSVTAPPASKAAVPGKFTCPMHPEVQADEPGACPICGMALEPRNVPADSANPELGNMTRRFWVAVAFTLPLLAVMVSDILPGLPLQLLLRGRWLGWTEFALATPAVLWAGWPFFQRGWASIIHRSSKYVYVGGDGRGFCLPI